MKRKSFFVVLAFGLVLAGCASGPGGLFDLFGIFGSGGSGTTGTQAADFVTQVNADGTVTITGYKGSVKAVVIPETIDGRSVTVIAKDAFDRYTGLTSIDIPASVIRIGGEVDEAEDAFDGCTGFTSITVAGENGVYSSEDGVLFTKDKTTLLLYPEGRSGSYTIPSTVTGIAISAFDTSLRLIGITIPDSVSSIGQQAFQNCIGLTSITIPDSVTYIGPNAFFDCTGLISVTVSPVEGRVWDLQGSVSSLLYPIFLNCPLSDASKAALRSAGYSGADGQF
jgi:hypothetical protein